jgi:cytochrome c553
MKIKLFSSSVILLCLSYTVSATEAVDTLLQEYQQAEEVSQFDVEAGKTMFYQEFTDEKSGKIRQCTTCHGDDLTQAGKHAKTGKVIEPLAPSVNEERLTNIKDIRKWLKRNCKWTIGRECTPQEKGDFLVFIQTQ